MKLTKRNDYRPWAIYALLTLAPIAIWFVNPIPQDGLYHQFADQKTILGIAHFWNVITNIPFILVALYGLVVVVNNKNIQPGSLLSYQMWIFLIGVFLTGWGSAYYHYNPNNATLVWDRLPLTLAFMALFSLVISEYLSVRVAKLLFIPLLIIGAVSIFYWDYTEQLGKGDLRLYVLVQFLPIIITPVVLLFYSKRSSLTKYIWWTFVFYTVAKFLELFDAKIYTILGIMSGHPLKHLSAAAAVFCLVKGMQGINKHSDR